MHPPAKDQSSIDNFIGPFSKKHYVIAEILRPGLWSESAHEHVKWCLWAKQGFYRTNTYFGVQFWFKRVDALEQANTIINAMKEMESE